MKEYINDGKNTPIIPTEMQLLEAKDAKITLLQYNY